MTKTWMRAAMGTALVAGLAVVGALVFTTRPALAEMMSGRTGMQMHNNHMAMMSNGSNGAMMQGGTMHGQMSQMMQGARGMMGSDMEAMHASMTAMHDKVHTEIAAVLGLSADELDQALADGTDISILAAEKNLEPAKVTEALIAAHKVALDELVAAGTLTQAQADQTVQHMASNGMGAMKHGGAHCDQALTTKS